ncbi:MAG: HAD-IA family hydrolase [Bacilli bacterium]
MKKPLLIFDFFGVVVAEVAHLWLKGHMDEKTAKEVIATLFVAVDEGRMTAEDCFKKLEAMTGVPYQEVEQGWLDYGVLNQDTYTFLKMNQDRYHIVLLSNASRTFLNHFFKMYDIDSLFLKKFVSSDLKMAKPNPAIFRYVLDNTPVSFDIAFMIDDNLANIKAAQALEIHGILFTSMAEVETQINAIMSDMNS